MIELKIAIVLFAAFIAWKDFIHREVEWFLFPLLLSLILANGYFANSINVEIILINGVILVVQLALLALWVFISKKQWLMKDEQYIGWGDIVFFVLLIFCFSTLNFIVFYLGSMMLVLLVSVVYERYLSKDLSIPLAGAQALLLSLVMIGSIFHNAIDLYRDDYWLTILKM